MLVYGLKDFTSQSTKSTILRKALRQDIERTIARFEPRLKNVKIHLDTDQSGNSLRFRINALLVIEPETEPVQGSKHLAILVEAGCQTHGVFQHQVPELDLARADRDFPAHWREAFRDHRDGAETLVEGVHAEVPSLPGDGGETRVGNEIALARIEEAMELARSLA